MALGCFGCCLSVEEYECSAEEAIRMRGCSLLSRSMMATRGMEVDGMERVE